jgi:hypothetical protein
LDIRIHGGILYPAYDFLCLASFLEASPSLETFILNILVSSISYCKSCPATNRCKHTYRLNIFDSHVQVPECRVDHGLFSGEPSQSQLVQTPEHCHDKLRCVKITGFYPEKSLLELACRVLQTATSLECRASRGRPHPERASKLARLPRGALPRARGRSPPRPDALAGPPRRPSLASTQRRLAIKSFRAAPRARTRSTVPSSPRARHCRRHSRAAPPLASGVGQPPLAPLDTLAHPPETQATGRCRRAHRN